MTEEEKYMARCFSLAKKGEKWASPNPMVGAVITYQDQIIGEGYHEKYGEAHAEVNAINSVKKEHLPFLSEATIYISLEPCFHFGKTPPCVDLILEKKIPKVVVSTLDPNPLVSGNSIEKLRAHQVEVKTGVLEEQGKLIIKEFIAQFH